MMSTYEELCQIVDSVLSDGMLSQARRRTKTDGSLVTDYDEKIEAAIVHFFQHLSDDLLIIGEESLEGTEIPDSFHLKGKDFLIVDPIDGTENFSYFSMLFGCAVSWRIDGAYGHMIYIPAQDLCIHTGNISEQSYSGSIIELYSSFCLNEMNFARPQNVRVVGSSSWMMSQFLSGNVKSYTYCGGAKLWDCYTGLSLVASIPDCQIILSNNRRFQDWKEEPTFKTKFTVRWI